MKDVVQGEGGNGSDGGANRSKHCWVAEALYGVDAPRTLLVRAWLSEARDRQLRWWAFVRLYEIAGRRVARLVGAGRLPRRPIERVFDGLVATAADESLVRLQTR